jgi:hypothetical protein
VGSKQVLVIQPPEKSSHERIRLSVRRIGSSLVFVIVVLFERERLERFCPEVHRPRFDAQHAASSGGARGCAGGDDKRDKNDPYESQFVYLL